MKHSPDHTQYRDEVEARWGSQAYADGDAWWRSMSEAERSQWKDASSSLLAQWRAAAESGCDPAGEEGQVLAARQVDWLSAIPGTPGYGRGGATPEYVLGLAEMYVSDARFAENYGGVAGASFVRDALRTYIENGSGSHR